MATPVLYIGNRRYSSWSLRGWLACRAAGIEPITVTIPLDQPDTRALILAASPSGKVPSLHIDGAVVWDSLAIVETLAERAPALWPADFVARAHARAVSAEMHAGFQGLRRAMWMNLGVRWPGLGRTPEALADIARIVALWTDTRARFGAGGPFLFGSAFTAADVMYAPVVTRFVTWEPELPDAAAAYVQAVWEHPLLREWRRDAEAEPAAWLTAKYETPPEA